jgi:hypothetical protein
MRARWVDAVWLFAFGAASAVWCLSAAARTGATFDEPFYVHAGMVNWRTGSNKLLMRAGTMPLPVNVQTFPAYLWERHRGRPFDLDPKSAAADLHAVLPVCRAANLAFWWLLLLYTMRLGRTFGGAWGGRLAVALAACDPNLLGHAALATTDVATLACVTALIYHFYHCYRPDAGWKRRVLVPGLLYGVALYAKVSVLAFGPQVMLVLGLWNLATAGALTPPEGSTWRGAVAHLWHATYQFRKDVVAIGLIGLATVFVLCGSDWGTEPTFIKWADGLPEGDLKRVMTPVSRELKIFTNAGEAIWHQIRHNFRGHGTYLLGEWHPRATPLYFPLALSMKVPVPVFALVLAALVVHPRRFLIPTGGLALMLLALSPTYRVQIGIRFVFPLIVLTYVTAAAAIARGWAEQAETPGVRAVPRWLVAALVAALAGTAAWAWPYGLSYFNQLWGGMPAGRGLLHDSNYDWGQGVPELRAWNEEHNGGRPLGVWYYGSDPDVNRAPLSKVPMSWHPVGTDDDARALCPSRYLAVGASVLDNNPAPKEAPAHAVSYEWARSRPVVARTPYFVIIRLRE